MNRTTAARIEAGTGSVPELAGAGLETLEPLYDPSQVAAYLGLDVSTVRRLFIDRPGVVKLGRTEGNGEKRQYCGLRIPLSVLRRFLEERSR